MKNLTYESYTKSFTIYPTVEEARSPGFQAHHINLISLQEGTRITAEDHRCFRLTPLEHITVHYLLAKERGGEYARAFSIMWNFSKNHKPILDQISQEDLALYAEATKNFHQEISDDTKVKMSKSRIGMKFTDTHKANISKALLNMSEDKRINKAAAISKAQKGKIVSEATREKVRKSSLGRKLSPETIAKRTATAKRNRENKARLALL